MLSSADVVVIGGGAVGISITYYLAKYGVRVCLVEKEDLGAGTSSACLGHVMLQTKTAGPKLDFARESVRLFHGLEEELEADFEFEWYEGATAFTSPVLGINALATNLNPTTYTVAVTEKASDCFSTASGLVPASASFPTVDAQVDADVSSCMANDGEASASVSGNGIIWVEDFETIIFWRVMAGGYHDSTISLSVLRQICENWGRNNILM